MERKTAKAESKSFTSNKQEVENFNNHHLKRVPSQTEELNPVHKDYEQNRTGDKGQPCRSPTCTCTGNRSDLLPAMRTKLLLQSYRETEQPLAKAPGPHTHGALPTEYHEGHGRMPSPDPQSTCGLVGQTPINPPSTLWRVSCPYG
ncbi:hypothetical protein L3Q82_011765 [Scortum barcoo]|uniref:Uncharacterized protein n=1 Tax=Scortum barcoo TaxID=214431 RepID=A0ACB8W622_9TELE|nr:hypothetical protein L3Q82_011765 [Scortum barcoo]